jgi:hypothetical protein
MAEPKRTPAEVAAAFVAKALKRSETVYVGIDPGTTGGIGLLCGPLAQGIDIPVNRVATRRSKKTTKKELAATGHKTKTVEGSVGVPDLAGICELFKVLRPLKARVCVVLEQVPTSLGPGKRNAEIMLNRAWAMWPLFLYSRNYRREDVPPAVWKAVFKLLKKDKEAARQKAMALFPKAELHLKDHHNRAEGLLLAEYGRRTYGRTGSDGQD